MIHFPKINVEQTPLYQEALSKGFHNGESKKALEMVLTLSRYRFDNLEEIQENKIKALSELQLDILAKALFDFKDSHDLVHWLNSNTKLLN